MLDKKGFDLWADGYDKSVDVSDKEKTYPFAGYEEVLKYIFDRVTERDHADVLDIGFGTGTLTAKLYENGCNIFGQDFSEKMIDLAQEKMPGAKLYLGDFTHGLREELSRQRYDAIIATYSLHHMTTEQKVEFIGSLRQLLKNNGKIYIGDVIFRTEKDQLDCAEASGDVWDSDEIYFVVEEMENYFPGNLKFAKMSFCAGVIEIGKG